MPEVLLIVPGVPRSKAARSAREYERQVREAARRVFDSPLTGRNLSVHVDHFYTSGNRPDLDNMLKSILDGLKGAAYVDDSQVVRVSAERYNILQYAVENPRPEWIGHIARSEEFVSVMISRRM